MKILFALCIFGLLPAASTDSCVESPLRMMNLEGASLPHSIKAFKGFRKFCLKTGKSKRVEFVRTSEETGFYYQSMEFAFELTVFTVLTEPEFHEGLGSVFEVIL